MATGDTELDGIKVSWKGIDPEISEQAVEDGLVPAGYVCKKLDISRRTLGRAIKSGEIEVARQIGKVRLFDPDDIEDTNLAESLKNPDQKGFLIEYLLESLSSRDTHIDELVKLTHKPIQDTIQALLSENKNLRERIESQWKTTAEVHELYGTMLRETAMLEVDVDKEKNKEQMKSDAFALLKDKLVPVMLDSYAAGNLANVFSTDEIEAFIESGAAGDNPKALTLLKKELAKRRKAEAKTEKKAQGDSNNGKAKSEKHAENSGPDSSK
jgi:DNA-binding transcriptional MerR regulator